MVQIDTKAPIDSGPDVAYRDVIATVTGMFDGLYHCDTEKLAHVFHPGAIYASASTGELTRYDMATYLSIVRQRVSPASRSDPRHERILSVEFAGPVTAMVRAEVVLGPKLYTDFLTLIRLDNRWQIIAKVIHGEPR